jgi:hypothetical protein
VAEAGGEVLGEVVNIEEVEEEEAELERAAS